MASKVNFLRARGLATITAADVDIAPVADALYCITAGDAIITDLNGTVSTVPMTAGQTLPVGIVRLANASTGTYFGLYE